MVTVKDLEALEVFNGFSSEQKKKLAAICEKKKYEMGKEVYLSKFRASRLFVVVKGKVDLLAEEHDGETGLSLGTLGDGQLFGGASILKLQRYTIAAFCLEDSELLLIESNDLFELIAGDYELGYKLMKKVAGVYLHRYELAKTQLHQMVKAAKGIAAGES